MRENTRAFEDMYLRPRSAVALADCDLRVSVLGHLLGFPAILAPVGYSRLLHPEGEMAAARAAGQFGTAYLFSTISGHKLENAKAESNVSFWYQLYCPVDVKPRRRENFSSLRVSGGFSSESILCGHAAELAQGKKQVDHRRAARWEPGRPGCRDSALLHTMKCGVQTN